jgi:sec-independent protein translocase protein TatA
MTGAPLAFMSLSFGEIAMLGIVAILVFGGRLPEVMRNAGRAYGKFRRGLDDLANPIRQEMRSLDDQASLSRRPTPATTQEKPLPPLATEPPPGVYPTEDAPAPEQNPDPDGDPDSLPEAEPAPPRPAPTSRPEDRGTAADEPPPV